MTSTEIILACVCGAQVVVVFALIWGLNRAREDAVRSIDRLLLLGKSSTPGEAIAAYERLTRIERARNDLADLNRPAKVRGADQPGSVATKRGIGANWFGFIRRPKASQPGG